MWDFLAIYSQSESIVLCSHLHITFHPHTHSPFLACLHTEDQTHSHAVPSPEPLRLINPTSSTKCKRQRSLQYIVTLYMFVPLLTVNRKDHRSERSSDHKRFFCDRQFFLLSALLLRLRLRRRLRRKTGRRREGGVVLVGGLAIHTTLQMVVPVGTVARMGLHMKLLLTFGHFFLRKTVLRRRQAMQIETVRIRALLTSNECVAVLRCAITSSSCYEFVMRT